MIDRNQIFGKHPSRRLNKAYKGYQGCNPEEAHIILLGKDPNYNIDIEQSPIFDELIAYLEAGIDIYVDELGIGYFRHHPFLNPRYNRGDGWRYHSNFRRIFGKCPNGVFLSKTDYDDYLFCARKTSFVELIGTPTHGMIKGKDSTLRNQAEAEFQQLLTSQQNSHHLKLVQSILFESTNKTVFVSREVYTILQGIFPRLEQQFPNDSYEIENLYTNEYNTCLVSSRHLSAAIRNEYFDTIRHYLAEN